MTWVPSYRGTTFTVFPDAFHEWEAADWDERYGWTIDVVDVGTGVWAVRWGGRVLSSRGEWHWETRDGRDDEGWLEAHRFGFHEAMEKAMEVVSGLKVMGRTGDEAFTWVMNMRGREK